jgi:hypothetical protein
MRPRVAARAAIDRIPSSAHRVIPYALRADLRQRLGLESPGDIGFKPGPPSLRPGEASGPPDFVELGVSDAGSRWWFSLLADHPGVAPSRSLTEVSRYFSQFATAPFGPPEVAQFHAYFPRRPGKLAGHWSPDGLAYPWISPLLAMAAPNSRVVVLVRDPIERLRSGLLHSAERRVDHVGSYLADAVDRGFYGEQLLRLFEFIPKEQVQVVQYERCAGDPVEQVAVAYRFLGLDDSFRPVGLRSPTGGLVAHRDKLDLATEDRLKAMYASDVSLLTDVVPDFDLSLWPNFAGSA